jgi:hypothetical protein
MLARILFAVAVPFLAIEFSGFQSARAQATKLVVA